MTAKLKPRDVFDVCLEVYKAARELVDERQPTMRLESASKFLWRPDLHPRLVEYVADFTLAGERALAVSPEEPKFPASGAPAARKPGSPPAADGQSATSAVKTPNLLKNFKWPKKPRRASRLILFRMHYLGGAEYETVRHFLGVSEVNCADWVDEIKDCVGRELLRARIFPPGRYFRELTSRRLTKSSDYLTPR